MSERRSYSVILVPEGGETSRTFHLSPLRLRLLKWGGAMALLLLVLVVASWGLLAVRASRVAELEARLDRAAAAEERVALLAEQLADLERRYARLRSMFGADSAGASSGPWLPPPAGGTSAPRPEGEVPHARRAGPSRGGVS